MTTKEMSDFINSLWCWSRCTDEEQRKLTEIADYLSTRGNEKNDYISRAEAVRVASGYCHPSNIAKELAKLPSVTPQEPILDKIRAEIDELYSYVEFDEDIKTSFNMVRLEEVQRVIDKYKAESEKA